MLPSRSVCVYMRFQRKKGLRSLRSLRPLINDSLFLTYLGENLCGVTKSDGKIYQKWCFQVTSICMSHLKLAPKSDGKIYQK